MSSRRVVTGMLLLASACAGESQPALRVDTVTFSEDAVRRLSRQERTRLADLAALGQIVARDEAEVVGEPLAARALERSRLSALPLYLASRSRRIDDEQLREVYAREPEWELTVRHIVRLVPRWAPAAERSAARERAEMARERAASGEDFSALAGEHSEEPGAADRGGLLEPAREGGWVQPFWEAASTLEAGEISPVVETEYGYHVLRLEQREPVPFEEADRSRLLELLIPGTEARAAMEAWVAARAGALSMDYPTIEAWWPRLLAGDAPRAVVLGKWASGLEEGSEGEYTASDAAVFRASLSGEERERLDRAGAATIASRLEQDARETMFAVDALRLGAPENERAAREAAVGWAARVGAWGGIFGFRSGMTDEEVGDTALRALHVRGQEAVIARADMTGIRPLLWSRYPVSGTLAPDSAAVKNSPAP